MRNDKCRESFEAWHLTRFGWLKSGKRNGNPSARWIAFQAGYAAALGIQKDTAIAAPAVANAAPEFPEPQSLIVAADIGHRAYSADQMRAYGQACALAAQAPQAALTDDQIHDIMSKHVDCSFAEGLAFARRIEAAAAPNAGLVALVQKAQGILAAYLPPTGPSKHDTITALLELLDGPESRAALANAGVAK